MLIADVCPQCGKSGTETTDSRPAANPVWRRRRRKCPHCDYRYTTMEVPEDIIERTLAALSTLDNAIELLQAMRASISAEPPPDILTGYRCGRCGAVSFNPRDAEEGYCGRCHRVAADAADGVSA